MAIEIPKELFTLASVGTYVGGSGAVIVLTNTFRKLTKREWPAVAFGFAVLVSLVGSAYSASLKTAPDYFIALLNACLLFGNAGGAQEIVVAATTPKPVGVNVPQSRPIPRWWGSWFR